MKQGKKIKILECIRQGKIGGGESHLLSLVENMDRDRFEPVVLSFTPGPMVDSLEKMGVKTHVIHSEKPFDFSVWKKVRKLLEEEQVDLVHAHGTRANSNVLGPARKLKLPVIYTIHGWSFHDDQPFWVRNLRAMGEKYLTSRSSLNISVSRSNQETGQRHFKGFHSTVINNGIDPRKFDPGAQYPDIRASLGILSQAILCGFIARFTHQKQPLVMISAFEKVAVKQPSLYLLLVGDGELKEAMEKAIAQSPVRNRIILSPPRSDIPALLATTDIFVLPSLWEGLPIALLEAMAMGKAIIASAADGTREIMVHGENGYMIPIEGLEDNLEKALVTLAGDKELRVKLGHGARATITENFDAGKMTRQVEKVYTEILETI